LIYFFLESEFVNASCGDVRTLMIIMIIMIIMIVGATIRAECEQELRAASSA